MQTLQQTYPDVFNMINKIGMIITPWKKYHPGRDYTKEYAQGWNDCIQDIKSRRLKLNKIIKLIEIK